MKKTQTERANVQAPGPRAGLKRVQVHIPYMLLLDRLDEILEAGLDPEIFMDGNSLEMADPADLERLREAFAANGRRVTVHGPYMDLSPGGADEKVRLATVERYRQTFEVVEILRPEVVVLHAGYDASRFDGDTALWLGQSRKTWPEFARKAERIGVVIALEHIFESRPETLKSIVEAIDSPNLGVCLDTGHINVFSKVPMEEWFEVLGPYIKEVHLHDNSGEFDEHLPLGDGTIDFPRVFGLLSKLTTDPVLTIEPHGESVLWRGLEAVRDFIE